MATSDAGGDEGGPNRFARFLAANREAIVSSWSEAARQLPHARHLQEPVLRDHVPMLLDRLIGCLGEAGAPETLPPLGEAADEHALHRVERGFDLGEVLAEYSLLRETIERLLEAAGPSEEIHWRDHAVLVRVLDQGVAVSVKRFLAVRERTLRALDRLSLAALQTGDVESLLPRLLNVLIDSSAAADSAAILLREGDRFLPRAAFGVPEAVLQTGVDASEVEEGLVPEGTELGRRFRAAGTRALQVSLLAPGSGVEGAVVIGSRTSSTFSPEDQLLFRSMADRATAMFVESRLAERERAAQSMLESLLTASPVGVAILDRALRYLHLNEALADSNGVPLQEHFGRTPGQILPPRLAGIVQPILEQVLHTGAPRIDVELQRELPEGSGQVRTWIASYFPIRTGEGEIQGVGGVVMDVTEQKRREVTLRDSEARLQLALEATQAGLFDEDLLTRETRWDAQGKALFGIPEHEEVTLERALLAIHPEDRPRLMAAVAEAQDPAVRAPFKLEFRVGENGGNGGPPVRWLLAQGRAFFEGGRATRFIGTMVDVTDRKRTEEELRQAALFREQFIGVLGHDLRNPLAAIRASADLMLRGVNLQPGQVRGLQRIISSADRMARMISDVLDFARGRLGGGFTLRPERINLHEVSRRVVDELNVAHPDRAMSFEARGDGWGEWDPDRLGQAISNLVGNALQHGSLETAVEVRISDRDHGVLLEVRNQGRPIPPESLPHLFEPFRGTHKPSERVGQSGLGLGLWIVREIVRAHRGHIEVRSSAEEGTTFSVWLPRVAVP